MQTHLQMDSIGRNLRDRIHDSEPDMKVYHIGHIYEMGDAVAEIRGLRGVKYGELLEFETGDYGVALNLLDDVHISAVVLTGGAELAQGTQVRSTERVLEVPVGDQLLGRVIDPLGHPLDDRGSIRSLNYRRIENEAPSILSRAPVNRPLQTGLLSIDAIVPIGRGQRELIIGDRQTGKTAIAIDTILHQRDENMYCVYVAIGQKASTVAQIVEILEETGALEYTCVVVSTASDAAPMQYIAPYSGCAIAEYWMNAGRDVLVIYDDLSKHAVAYREMSLLLKRPPGREAYPGDIFYLHSRLLERAAQLSAENGGGSITALPIIETLAGDISAYIPTNVISITDGQIYLESELFNSGVRPAVNVGLSVSRVGGAAQSKAMRRVSGKLRLDLAQYRELAVFAQFGSELDASTQQLLQQGMRMTETLKQDQYKPMGMAVQVVLLAMVTAGHLLEVPLKQVRAFNEGFIEYVQTHLPTLLSSVAKSGAIADDQMQSITEAVKTYKSHFFRPDGSTRDGLEALDQRIAADTRKTAAGDRAISMEVDPADIT